MTNPTDHQGIFRHVGHGRTMFPGGPPGLGMKWINSPRPPQVGQFGSFEGGGSGGSVKVEALAGFAFGDGSEV